MRKIIALLVTFLIIGNICFSESTHLLFHRTENANTIIDVNICHFNKPVKKISDIEIGLLSSVEYTKNGKTVTYKPDLVGNNGLIYIIKNKVALVSPSLGIVYTIHCENTKDAINIAIKLFFADMICNKVIKKYTTVPKKIESLGHFKQRLTGKGIELIVPCEDGHGKNGRFIEGFEKCTYVEYQLYIPNNDEYAVANYYKEKDFVICSCNGMENQYCLVLEGFHADWSIDGCKYQKVPFFEEYNSMPKGQLRVPR